jgi:hypothetical protein
MRISRLTKDRDPGCLALRRNPTRPPGPRRPLDRCPRPRLLPDPSPTLLACRVLGQGVEARVWAGWQGVPVF